jgi:hypothetical protein
MWDDSTNWDDSTYWSDTSELDVIGAVETVVTVQKEVKKETLTAELRPPDVVTTGDIESTIEITDAVPAGYALMAVYIVETADQGLTVKGGSTAGGSEWFGETVCGADGVTSISVNKMLSTTAATSVHLTVTAGSGYKFDAYCLISRIL